MQEGYGVPNPSAELHTDRTSNLYSRSTMIMTGGASAAQGSFSAAGVNECLVEELQPFYIDPPLELRSPSDFNESGDVVVVTNR